MQIKVVDASGQEAQPSFRPDAKPAEVYPDGLLLHQQIADLFDLKNSEVSHYKTKLNTLIEYAKSQTDDHSTQGLKWAIRELSFRVGTPPLGEKMINYLTLYAHTRTKRAELDKEIAKFERREDGDDN